MFAISCDNQYIVSLSDLFQSFSVFSKFKQSQVEIHFRIQCYASDMLMMLLE